MALGVGKVDQWEPEAQAERFLVNRDKAQFEGEFTIEALMFGIDTERALILSGPNTGGHQSMARKFDEVIFAENNYDRWLLGRTYLRGMKHTQKDGAVAAYRSPGAPLPKVTRLYYRDVFELFGKFPSFGLIDLDMCCKPNPKVLTGIHYVLNENSVAAGRFALRLTLCQRGVAKETTAEFLAGVDKHIEQSPYKSEQFNQIGYREHLGPKDLGTSMIMGQWLLKAR